MIFIKKIKTNKDLNNNIFGSFMIEPLEIGQGITLATSLRRTIYSLFSEFFISSLQIPKFYNEINYIFGLRENLIDLNLNLKQVIFKVLPKNENYKNLIKFQGIISIQGPVIITASHINLPKEIIKIINPFQYICTLVEKIFLTLYLNIKKTKYSLLINKKQKSIQEHNLNNYNLPIKKLNYKIKLIHDYLGNIKECLIIEIITDGSISPQRCLLEGIKSIYDLFLNIFYNLQNFLFI